jgi:rhodanese-related sulfurtransferase
MEMLLTVWYVFTFGVLIWISLLHSDGDLLRRRRARTSKPCLDYIVISPALLSDWEAHQSNLIIIDLRTKRDSGRDPHAIPGALSVPARALAAVLRWIPAGTRLVFYEQDQVGHFNPEVEGTLVSAGVNAVYLLDGGIDAWHAQVSAGTGLRGRFPGDC